MNSRQAAGAAAQCGHLQADSCYHKITCNEVHLLEYKLEFSYFLFIWNLQLEVNVQITIEIIKNNQFCAEYLIMSTMTHQSTHTIHCIHISFTLTCTFWYLTVRYFTGVLFLWVTLTFTRVINYQQSINQSININTIALLLCWVL